MDMTDLYAVLGVGADATTRELRKAYRLKSLVCHPDRAEPTEANAQMFLAISAAVDTLTDDHKRPIYDAIHRSRTLQNKRFADLDAGRKKARLDLEHREAAAVNAVKGASEADKRKIEIERIREAGARSMLANEEVRRQEAASTLNHTVMIKNATEIINSAPVSACTLKVKWQKDSVAPTAQYLRKLINAKLDSVLVGKRSALLVFSNVRDSFTALSQFNQKESGLKIGWMDGTEPIAIQHLRFLDNPNTAAPPANRKETYLQSSTLGKGQEYEDRTLKRMMDAEKERAAMIAEILLNDE